VDSNGILQNVNYEADSVNGFRVAATNLPVGPAPVVAAPVAVAPVAAVAPVPVAAVAAPGKCFQMHFNPICQSHIRYCICSL